MRNAWGVKWADFLTTSYQALSSQVKTHRVDQEKRARPPPPRVARCSARRPETR